VNIDSGDITIESREILKTMHFKHTPLATRTTLGYLADKRPWVNRLTRPWLLGAGTLVQRVGAGLLSPVSGVRPFSRNRPMQLVRSKMPWPDLTTLRSAVPMTLKNQAMLLEPRKPAVSTVFYFPGCGSERIYSRVSRAALFILLSGNHRVILPPPFLCCGYPFLVNAMTRKHEELSLKNIIVLTQVREMFNDLTFDAVVVSCGTCMESLARLDAAQIFDSPVQDVSDYVLKKSPQPLSPGSACFYHAPCHDSLKANGAALLRTHGFQVTPVPHCCSQAGTLALSRPDIGHHMLVRKQEALARAEGVITDACPKILTNCPSCLQGLGRLAGVRPVHLTEALAMATGGDRWKTRHLDELTDSVEKVTF
jgi:Fe-S oxidoreductase